MFKFFLVVCCFVAVFANASAQGSSERANPRVRSLEPMADGRPMARRSDLRAAMQDQQHGADPHASGPSQSRQLTPRERIELRQQLRGDAARR
jgi:hypothetical protein